MEIMDLSHVKQWQRNIINECQIPIFMKLIKMLIIINDKKKPLMKTLLKKYYRVVLELGGALFILLLGIIFLLGTIVN